MFFFFKQKSAYEIRISDWSSDLCSSDLTDVGQSVVVEGRTGGVGESTALGDRQVAGVGAGAGDDVAGELGAGLGHPDLGQALEQHGQLALAEPPEGEVLPVRDPHVGTQLPLDRRQRPELRRSEEHTSEIQSLMRISYALFC